MVQSVVDKHVYGNNISLTTVVMTQFIASGSDVFSATSVMYRMAQK
jgi:hypothetical protein